jgi:hypothetical protein
LGIFFPSFFAASSQAFLAFSTSFKASTGVFPNAEQNDKSGISAIYPSSSSLKKY